MKEAKFQQLIEDISEFIAERGMASIHHVTLEDVFRAFPHVKKKHLRKAYNEVI